MREAAKKDERGVGRKEGRKAGKMGVLKRKECRKKGEESKAVGGKGQGWRKKKLKMERNMEERK